RTRRPAPMLQIIRSKITGLVAKVLFIFLAIVFGLWGIGDYAFLRETERPVITVGDVEISAQRFDQEYRRTIERYRRAMGQFDTAMARQLNVADQVVQRLINEAAIDHAVAALGIVVGDDMVRARILADPSFRGAGGQFDRNVLVSLLSQNQMNEAQFFAMIRQNMARDAVSEAIASGAMDVEAATRELVAQSVASLLGAGADPAAVEEIRAEVEALLAGDPTLAHLLRGN
ncbi:MAG: SurA N-terminal domain-containing protein, partial [Deltaproteobacteria bacterium]|nr:SurA N-terminal domain-containing protein [Nannocystaceae bacterium]